MPILTPSPNTGRINYNSPFSGEGGLQRDGISVEDLFRYYLLYDNFNDARSAGGVNNTFAIPTGGLRTVTDTNSKLSIVGGVFDFATGAAANDGVWWSSLARKAGQIFKATVIPADTDGILNVGWDNGTSGAILDALRFAASGVLQVIANGGTAVQVGTYSAATAYTVTAQMRATGVAWYIKGGAFTFTTFLFDTASGTAAGVPAINVGSTTTIATADDAKVPAQILLPAPLASDGFSGATTDGLGHAEANGGAGLTWTGATWTVAAGAVSNAPTQGADVVLNGTFAADTDWSKGTGWSIAGGVAVVTPGVGLGDILEGSKLTTGAWYIAAFDLTVYVAGAGARLRFGTTFMPAKTTVATHTFTGRASTEALGIGTSGDTDSYTIDNVTYKPLTLSTLFRSLASLVADATAQVEITLVAGTQAGIVFNLDSVASPANFGIIYIDGTNCNLVECVAGVYTSKIAAAVTYGAANILKVVRRGTTAIAYYNGLLVGTIQTLTANTNTIWGLFDTSPSLNSMDNFVMRAAGSNGEYSAGDGF